jgi:LysR family transcriptional regulator, cell division regulator
VSSLPGPVLNWDFGIVVNPLQHPDLMIKELWKDTVLLWTSNSGSGLQDLKTGKAVLICDLELIQTESVMKQIKKSQFQFQRLVTSSSLQVIASLVGSGAGIGILPTRVAKNSALNLALKPVKGSSEFADRHCLIFHADAQRSRAIRNLAHEIEHFLIQIKGNP